MALEEAEDEDDEDDASVDNGHGSDERAAVGVLIVFVASFSASVMRISCTSHRALATSCGTTYKWTTSNWYSVGRGGERAGVICLYLAIYTHVIGHQSHGMLQQQQQSMHHGMLCHIMRDITRDNALHHISAARPIMHIVTIPLYFTIIFFLVVIIVVVFIVACDTRAAAIDHVLCAKDGEHHATFAHIEGWIFRH